MQFKVMVMVSLLFGASCKSQDLQTVSELNLERYMGTWYEIARLPNSFEKGLDCITATYTLRPDGRVTVENRGVKSDGRASSVKGTAWVPNREETAKLRVRFFWPFAGKYWVLHIDDDYRYALVGEPRRKYLWILSKSSTIDSASFKTLVKIASEKGFDTERIVLVKQNCSTNK